MELAESVKACLERIGTVLCKDEGIGVSVVKNKGVNKAGGDMGERSRFLV